MLSNDKMKAGRFLRWQRARRKAALLNRHLEAGNTVYVCTYTRATKFSRKHAGAFIARRDGVYIPRGKSFDYIDGCKIEVHGKPLQ